MKRPLLLAVSALFAVTSLKGQYAHTVIPVGNLADVEDVRTYARHLLHLMDSLGGRQTLLITGDVIRDREDLNSGLSRLDTFLATFQPEAGRRIIFIPGDRDWDDSGAQGWESAQQVEDHVRGLDRTDVQWPLRHGCPGPEKIDLDLSLSLIVINTQWWNHPYEKPTPESAVCEIATHEEAKEEIEKIIEETRFGNIVIAGHFPVKSGGPYGGHYPVSDWLFPVPVVSTMITAHKQNVGSPREICNPNYTEFREDMEDLLTEYPSLIYISGHEHVRELLRFGDNVLVQSGAPVKGDYISESSATIYAEKSPGVIALHYDMDGNAWTSIYDLNISGFEYVDRIKLLQAPCMTPLAGVPINQRLVPCLDDRYVLPGMMEPVPDDTLIAANPGFGANGFKRLLLGEHYRKSWTTPVTVGYLDLDHYKGGLVPYQEGGGRQTKTLRFTGEDGGEYVFRSVDKDPSKALALNLRESIISILVRDQITTAHPYGALASNPLLDKIDLLHPAPELYAIPDDEKLGPFKEVFGNMMGMMEERPSGRKDIQKTFGSADEVLGSTEMFREMYKDRDNRINAEEYARARIFDLWVGDWSKHEDNWKWAGYERGNEVVFRPIPRDRDHVFSRWDGFLPWLVDREWAKPQGENFGYKIVGLRSLMWQSRHLDRFLANELTAEDWHAASDYLQSHITDADIDSAMHAFPREVENISGPEIADKLKVRLHDLDSYAQRYYEMIATQVDVCGSNKSELFDVTRNSDGSMDVSMYKIRQGEQDKLFYSRRFLPGETKEVRLFGLQGDDIVRIHGESRNSILLRVVPGAGNNQVTDSSRVDHGRPSTRVYSLYSSDVVSGGKELKQVNIPNPDAYQYDRTRFAYNIYMPLIYVSSSSGNGVVFGGGITFTRQAYDKPDYSAIHSIAGSVSSLGNVRVSYHGKVRHVISRWDLTFGTQFDEHRRLNYFFGTGNNTTLDHDLLLAKYYTLRHSYVEAEAGLSRTFWDRSTIEFGLNVKGSGRENMPDNIFEPGAFPDVAGLERLRIAKGYVRCDIDFRDQIHLPTRGMRFAIEGALAGALNDATNYANSKATLEYFGTVKPITLGVKIGGAVHDGVTPFYDLYYLGQNTDLRGYRQNRFTGKTLAFLNADMRIQLVDNPHALIPYKLGVTLFYDTGRIFNEPEPDNDIGWHQGYGFNVYFVPLKERFALQVAFGFSDEESGLLKVGFGQAF